MSVGWRVAMAAALYGHTGFYLRAAPAEHFRTSVHASPAFAGAAVRLIERVDEALGHRRSVGVVDVGAGRGELIPPVRKLLPPSLAARVRFTGVEVVPRPDRLDAAIH